MQILITGAGGQVGLELATELQRRGHDVLATDLNEAPTGAPLTAAVRWERLDVTSCTAVRTLVGDVKPEAIFHLAAILSARGEQAPQRTYEVNQQGTYHILEASRELGVRRVMFTSTIAVFGPGLPQPVQDDVPLHPRTMYGITKVAGELLGDYYRRRFGLDFRGVRFPGLISASLPGGGTSDYALFMYLDGIRHGRYEAFCRPDTMIPLMYMPDGIRALIELFEADRSQLTRSIYNIAAMSPTAEEIANSVRRELPAVAITFASDPNRQAILDSWPRALDDRLARRDWGWSPRYDLEAMTADLVPRIRDIIA